VKGLIIAAAIHALYNTLVGPVTTVLSVATGLPQLVSLFVFVLLFQGAFAYVLLRKLRRYRDAYLETRDAVDPDVKPEMTEFED